MSRTATIAALPMLVASVAAGQSASVAFVASSTTVAPGATVSVTAQATFDIGGAMGGPFGNPGLFGFGGNVEASGPAAASASGSAPALNTALDFGPTTSTPGAGVVVRAAGGRGFAGGIAASPADLVTFDVAIAPDAQSGQTVTLDFDGTVVLVIDDRLVSVSTNPGPNQLTLTTTPVTLTIGGGACSPADLASAFGQLDIFDILEYFNLFGAGDPVADFDGSGGLDIFDILGFFEVFAQGC